MLLLEESTPDDPPLDLAVTHALLRRVAARDVPATMRLYRPGPTVAFGRLDALLDGFGDAIEAARAHGFTPVLRSVGGHAAAYTSEAIVYEEITPQERLAVEVRERFEDVSGLLVAALVSLGADARVGEIPGEYCPGEFSVNACGNVKLVGVAQRVVARAALVSAVVVVRDGERVRAVLRDVNARLGVEWEPRTAGALADVVPGSTSPPCATRWPPTARGRCRCSRHRSTPTRSRWLASWRNGADRAASALGRRIDRGDLPGPAWQRSRPAGRDDRERQPAERERAEHEPEVAQRDVVVLGGVVRQQVDDDARQPARHDERAYARRDRHEETRHDLDRADDVHEVLAASGDDGVDPAGEVVRPVHGPVEELVDAEEDRRDGEADPQQPERLVGGGADVGLRGGGGAPVRRPCGLLGPGWCLESRARHGVAPSGGAARSRYGPSARVDCLLPR